MRPKSEASDAQLLEQDDAEAFTTVYDRHAGKLYGWARVRVGDYAADLTAEVFARAWCHRTRFKDPGDGSAFPWLLGIAMNVLRSSLRKERIETSARGRLGLPTEIEVDPGFEEVERRLSLPEVALRAVASLPESERRLLFLRVVEDRSYAEIAERLGCTPAAARLRVSRSLRRLRLSIGGEQN